MIDDVAEAAAAGDDDFTPVVSRLVDDDPASFATTPAMAQYAEIKAANPDCLLFFRMGDFYEMFFDDAVAAAAALGIVLTKRGKHMGQDIPLCGVPVRAADEYLQRLIRKGFRVAVCEQMEDPAEAKKRGAKAVVRRDVIRLVTPGTLTEDTLLDARRNNFLTALWALPQRESEPVAAYALASADISTGELLYGTVNEADLSGELSRLLPSELVLPDSMIGAPRLREIAKTLGTALTPVAKAFFDSHSGERELKARLGVTDTGGYGTIDRGELAAIGAVLKYIDLTQLGHKPLLQPPRRSGPGSVLVIDQATRANLELLRNNAGGRDGSLLAAIDRTVTGAGARELAARLASPLRDVGEINRRLDAVGYLIDNGDLRQRLRDALQRLPDIARAMSRLALQRGSPRDLGAVRDGLLAAGSVQVALADAGAMLGLPEALAAVVAALAADTAAVESELVAALADELPLQRRDGGFVRSGYRDDLEHNRRLRDESRQVIAGLQHNYQQETGVKTLKVKHNNVLGFFVEVGQANARPLTAGDAAERFRHRQTLASAMRFTTAELIETEGAITAAAERALAIEQEVFEELTRRVATATAELTAIAGALAVLDATQGLAEVASEWRYCRPSIEEGRVFAVSGGRHPVVEQALKAASGGAFIDNDCVLGGAVPATRKPRRPKRGDELLPVQTSDEPIGFEEGTAPSIWLVTGPNMAGKSTFLRQNALIAILAQVGSYVPAGSARIGIVDRLFSRVGASDDLARGRSTFMVEMVETAAILNQAGENSFVILDEIGRGTATFDGLSIAWATVEYLDAVSRCRALFATHYHELTALAGKLPSVANATIEVREWQDEIVFLHKVMPGAADRSYGIQVAKLAGLPRPVIERAGAVLRLLEQSDERVSPEKLIEDLPLFAAARPKGHVPACTTGGRRAAGSCRTLCRRVGAIGNQPGRAVAKGGARDTLSIEGDGAADLNSWQRRQRQSAELAATYRSWSLPTACRNLASSAWRDGMSVRGAAVRKSRNTASEAISTGSGGPLAVSCESWSPESAIEGRSMKRETSSSWCCAAARP